MSEAATGLFSGLVDAERVAAVESSDERIDRDLWAALAGADLLGLAIDEADGGAGYGLMELCLLLEAQGNVVAPVPLWATLVLGALPVARFGSEAQRARWLPGVVAGEVILTAALTGTVSSPTFTPPVHATAAGEGWVLDGTELAVPQAHLADRIMVPARTDGGGVVLALVDPKAAGVTLERAVTTNREIHPHLTLAGVAVAPEDVLVGPVPGRAVLDFVVVAATISLCALQVGVCESALHEDRGLSESAPTVRAAPQHVPGHHAAGGRRRHRHRGDAGHLAERGVALRHRSRCGGRRPGGQVAGVRAGAADGARHPAPARGPGGRHLLPDPPLLLVGQADRAAAGRPERAAGAPRSGIAERALVRAEAAP